MQNTYSYKMLFFSILFIANGAFAQTPMSLDDCYSYAYTNNTQVKVAQLQVVDADWRVKENKATGYPQVSFDATYTGFIQRGGLPSGALSFGGGGTPDAGAISTLSDKIGQDGVGALGTFIGSLFASDPDSKLYFSPVHSVSGTLGVKQLIFNNSYLVAIKAARYYKEYVNIQLAATRETVRNQVTDAYLPALLLSDNLAILDKNIGNLEKLLGDTKAINKAGFAEQLDVDRLELSLSNLRSERENLARQREIVVNALKFTMGMPVSEVLVLSDDVQKLLALYGDADLTSAPNLQNRAEYQQLMKGRELSALQLDIYNKPWMPTVAAFLQYQPGLQGGFGAKGSDGHNKWYFIPSSVAGLSVSVPLYDGGGSKAKKERVVIEVQTIELQKAMLENAVALQLENARKQYINAQDRTKSQQKNLDLAQRIYETTQTKYKAGIGSSFEIVTAEQGLYAAQQAVMSAQFDLLAAKVAIKKALNQ